MQLGFRFAPAFACTLAFLSACSGNPVEPQQPGIEFLAGSAVTDTAFAIPVQALVAEVRGPGGALQPGVLVRFESVLSGGVQSPTVFVGPVESNSFGTLATATTDAQGRAAVRVRLGRVVGTGGVVVSVPTLGFQDTATYTITPGAPARVVAALKDTALYVGASVPLRAVVTDRHGNARTDVISYTAGSGAISVDGNTLRANAVGRGFVLAKVQGEADTVWVSVVPQGTLAASTGAYRFPSPNATLVTFNLDGSGFRQVTGGGAYQPAWLPSGNGLVFDRNDVIHVTDLAGNTKQLLPAAATPGIQHWARPSRDGAWIYFGTTESRGQLIWRVKPDGTGLQQITPVGPLGSVHEGRPSPAPNGASITYYQGGGTNVFVRIRDLADGMVRPMSVAGHAPTWSPKGDLIVYSGVENYDNGSVRVVRPDGTGQRVISQPRRWYEFGLDWSPDGKWVVGRSRSSGMLELIEVDTGLTLPLAFTRNLHDPVWKP